MTVAELNCFITYNPTTVTRDTPLDVAMQRMDVNEIRHLPVVDDGRRVVGVVSDLDISRAVMEGQARKKVGQKSEVATLCRVDDVIVRDPITVDHRSSPQDALRVILENRIHSLPVVEGDGLVGILTSTDFLREFSYGGLGGEYDRVAQHMKDALQASIEPTTPLEEAREIMQERGLEFLVVSKGLCPLGVVSLRDLRRATLTERCTDRFADSPVIGLLGDPTPTIWPQRSLRDAAKLMIESRVKALAVVNRASELTGLISEDDLLEVIAGCLA